MTITKLKTYKFFEDKTIKKLILLPNQGHCNHNYLLQTKNQNYLLREFKLTNDRKSEFKIQKKVSKKAIGSKPIIIDETQGFMLCEFIEGKHKVKLTQQELKKLAKLLKKLHHIKDNKKVPLLKKYFKFKDKKVNNAFISLKKEPKELRLCHNDLHSKNILFYKKNIKFIDWEYAGVNDLYFDLVSIIIEYKLNKKDESSFLKAYFYRKKINLKKITAYKIIYKELWRVWFEKLDKGEL